ncbi:MAG: AAA family ATPase [Fimbriimonadales bacterium]|nr:AAA family ATPase [Fimbriimonadales bacterium]
MKPAIERLDVSGFLSIKQAQIELGQINVLIGSNGSGKSNLLRLFELLRAIVDDGLTEYVARAGGADALLHYGRRMTNAIDVQIHFRPHGARHQLVNIYACTLVPSAQDTLIIATEEVGLHDKQRHAQPYRVPYNVGGTQSILKQLSLSSDKLQRGVAYHVLKCMNSYKVYHFHDTSESAPVKQRVYYGDNLTLHADGRNLAAMLLRLQRRYPERYQQLIETIRLALPFFGDFVLEPLEHERTMLRWRERGRDAVFSPQAFSDGGLRYICLMTLFHLPAEWLPSTILLDEPELGLHPQAIRLLAAALRSAATETQVIVSTQSPLLLDNFAPEEIVVVERGEEGSTFRRLTREPLEVWLEDYAMGELWEKNLVGGQPPR